ncbi:hypothetical protein V6N13_108410 [Hibiscus sabdariffa]
MTFGLRLEHSRSNSPVISVRKPEFISGPKEDGDSSNQSRMKRKRIQGYVEEEELWKMKRCLVGVMTSVCSVRNISSRLSEWGLGEIKVQRLGGKIYLLTFEDDELYMMLEDLDWSYLKEIFCEVSPWSESLNCLERATWLEVSGVPLYCWNSTTLKRLACLWGHFEAFGENVNHVHDCENTSILITTNQAKRIEEVVEIELGSMVYEISVVELGFSDSSTEIRTGAGVVINESCKVNKASGSITMSSSESEKDELEGDRSVSVIEKETFNELCPEEAFNNYPARDSEIQGCKIGESELMGGGLKEIPQLVPKNQGKSSRLLEQTHEQKKDISQLEIDIIEKVNNGGPIWVDQISKKSLNVDGQNVESREDAIGAPPVINSIRNFGVENERNKRYGSLRCFQEKAISEIEKKKRDRAIRREKKKAKGWDSSQLSGRSISDSDLVHRWELSTMEARKALTLGKSLGIQIEGNEDEAVREIARLELD